MSGVDRSELAAAVIAAINSRDPDRIRPLLAPAIEIRTSRTYSGPEQAIAWAGKRYDHLDRRYVIVETRVRDDQVLILGRVEYVWREDGEVGDSAPIALTLGFAGDGLVSLGVDDDQAAASVDFES